MATIMSTLRIVMAPKSRAAVIRILAAQVGPTRVQPGCLRCDLYQDIERRATITLVEEWETQAALDRRLRSEDYRAVLAAIDLAQAPPVIHFDTVTRRTVTVGARAMVHMWGLDTAVEGPTAHRAARRRQGRPSAQEATNRGTP